MNKIAYELWIADDCTSIYYQTEDGAYNAARQYLTDIFDQPELDNALQELANTGIVYDILAIDTIELHD